MQIVLKNISKEYDYPIHCLALHDINIEVNEGESIAIMGKSGCGKSTLLNILAGLTKPSTGEYWYNGNVLVSDNISLSKFRRDNIGIVVQNFALLNNRTAYDNIALSVRAKNKDTIKEVADKLGIREKLDYYPYQLSGGECQRVAIARAIINKPSIILADEPTGALDTATGQSVIDILKSLSTQGVTLIIATHDKNIGYQCNRVLKMKDGTIT